MRSSYAESLSDREPGGIFTRALHWLNGPVRPWLGWIAFIACLVLVLTPANAMRANRWIRLEQTTNFLSQCAAYGVIVTWWLMGWQRPAVATRWRWLQRAVMLVALALVGLLVVSVLVIQWVPPLDAFARAFASSDPTPLVEAMYGALERFATRYTLWRIGAQAGVATADEVVFAFFSGILLWWLGVLTAWLCYRGQRAFVAALPVLLVTGAIVFISGSGPFYFILAIAMMLLLHVALDVDAMRAGWATRRLDYNRELLLERWATAAALIAVALTAAWFMPSISVDSIAEAYSNLMDPVDDRLEEVRRSSFPNVETAPRFDPATAQTTTGLPNQFLLGAAPTVNQTRILLLRTSDSPSTDFAPRAPYLRSTALSVFIGKGWQKPVVAERIQIPANQRRTDIDLTGRRPLAQNVQIFEPPGNALTAAAPLEASSNIWLDFDAQGELISTDIVARNYTIVAGVPAVSDRALESLPAWDASNNPLPAGFEAYLQLPPTTTARTHALAQEIIADITQPYLQARAIEEYLRAFPYDLTVDAPPEDVSNVADYFLFDLQRGYCDYFATSFVVLARAVGLPTRFVIGYAPGSWQPEQRAWIVTAAQAHSWPEVYLPRVGWVAFEPTSGIAPLTRVGVDSLDGSQPLPEPPQSQEDFVESFNWNWQMLVWLLPIAALLWGAWQLLLRFQRRRQDPWQALLAWGNRHGRPHAAGETTIEYAQALAALASTLNRRAPEAARTVARESVALADAVAATQYALPEVRPAARTEVISRWQRIRDLLPLLKR